MPLEPPAAGVADTLGLGGVYTDPLWRQQVRLTPLEQELLRCWWVRRLAFVVHAGAAAISSTQSYSRLEHSLGLLTLVAHFVPDDQTARAAALLHDVGHLPLSHTFEGVAGLDHHRLGAERIRELAPTLAAHGVDAEQIVAVVDGREASALHGPVGTLRLDHLESWVRSGQAHGRTRQAPPETLARLRLVGGAVDTDAATAAYVVELALGEARSQTSTANVVATGIVRHLATTLLGELDREGQLRVAALTDPELWALLLNRPTTGPAARALLRDPASWTATPVGPGATEPGGGVIEHELTRLYLDLPLVDGQALAPDGERFAGLPVPPQRYVIHETTKPFR